MKTGVSRETNDIHSKANNKADKQIDRGYTERIKLKEKQMPKDFAVLFVKCCFRF